MPSGDNAAVPELTVETERRTQLLDVTDQVAELLADSDGSLATLFVPHTTAGIVLQAAGEGASAVATDVAGAFENDSLVNCAAHVCDWTWFALGDVHANTAGYGGIAEAFEQVLP